MNRSSIICFAVTLVLALAARVSSQTVTGAKNTIQQLEAVKAANAVLLDKQAALLLKLDELVKEAAQTKFMVKRG